MSDLIVKKKNTKKNYIYNLLYQIFALITPLVTTPYIARVLGSSGVGQVSFTYSIVTYFLLLGSLGFGYYAQREIAKFQNNKQEQSKIFFEIMIAKLVSVAVSLIIYIGTIFVGIYDKEYTLLMWILTINVVSNIFDVTFLFQGNEEFGIIAFRNIVVKIIGIALIFIFVKNESHVWLYTLCQSIILIVSNISLWTRLPKMLNRVRLTELDVFRHFKPTLRLFIPTIAVSVYTVLDKTLIGILVPGTTYVDGIEKKISDIENGFYDQAERIVKMSMTIFTSLGTVMIPRNSNVLATGDKDEFKKNIYSAFRFVFFLGAPITFGLIAIAFNFSPWFFGDGYEKVPYLMTILSSLVMIIGFSNVLGLQYLIPQQEDKKYTKAITAGAIVNFALNLVLIPFFWSYGAAVATIIAEIVVTGMMFIFARNDVKLIDLLHVSWKYILSSLLMFLLVFTTQLFLRPGIIHTIILVLEGLASYFAFLLIFKDNWFVLHLKKVFRKIGFGG